MEKRSLLAIFLSLLVIIGFQYWFSKHYSANQAVGTPRLDNISHRQSESPAIYNKDKFDITNEKEITYETEKAIFTFSNVGGAIKKIELKEFPDSKTGENYILTNILKPKFYIGALEIPEMKFPSYPIYQLEKKGNNLEYTYKSDTVNIIKKYIIHNTSDFIELKIIIKNLSPSFIAPRLRIVAGSYISLDGAMASRYVYVSSKIDGKVFIDRRNVVRSGDISWVALSNKYFCIILRPSQLGRKVIVSAIKKGNLACSIEAAPFTLQPESEGIISCLFYFGPTDINRLKSLNLGLEEIVNYGVFSGISKLLLKTLRFFHNIVGNWGVAIICMTFLINLILFPLTRKSYKSMRAMQELQPHIEKLRTIHKDNPHKLNKELIELYKRYNVNPLGGCLPLLLQMPIFIALYQTLMRSIELRGATFLWIKDLSKPDNLMLPFTFPLLGDSINILPILMVIAMIVQQKISSPYNPGKMNTQQKQQQQMMLFMPIIFGIIFYTLPSGLVLYWLTNTIVMTSYQYYNKTHNKLVALQE